MLDDASRVLAVASMLLASRKDGQIPDDLEYLKRVAYLNSFPDLNPLITCGFLEEFNIESVGDASTMLANASNTLASASSETEKRQRREEAERTLTRVRDPVDNSKGNGGWWKTDDGVRDKGEELGVRTYPGESMQAYKDRIFEHLNSLKSGKFNR